MWTKAKGPFLGRWRWKKCVRMTRECTRANVASRGRWAGWETGVLAFSLSWWLHCSLQKERCRLSGAAVANGPPELPHANRTARSEVLQACGSVYSYFSLLHWSRIWSIPGLGRKDYSGAFGKTLGIKSERYLCERWILAAVNECHLSGWDQWMPPVEKCQLLAVWTVEIVLSSSWLYRKCQLYWWINKTVHGSGGFLLFACLSDWLSCLCVFLVAVCSAFSLQDLWTFLVTGW